MIKKFASAVVLLLAATVFVAPGSSAVNSTLPQWAENAVIYEVNVRQFSPAGNFKAVENAIPRLKSLGVDILWLMPIHPISLVNRKGSLGSPYSVGNYTEINPSYGTAQDFQALVDAAHAQGMKVIIDWVANHSGWDNPWLLAHKDWYTQDRNGNVIWPSGTDWTDVADLNYGNASMRRAMTDAMKYWVSTFGIDGFRCDVAGAVPRDFWESTKAELDAIKPVFMLAENGDDLGLLNSAFHANYGWELQSNMRGLVNSGDSPAVIQDMAAWNLQSYPANSFSMNFITNHDENSWNGTEYERYGSAANAMAVLTYTLPGMPLIYNGQEIGLDRRLSFFDKDQIDWNAKTLALYPKLNALKHDNAALNVGAARGSFATLKSSNSASFVFGRAGGGDKVVTVINAANVTKSFSFNAGTFAGYYKDVISGIKIRLRTTNQVRLGAWKYRVLTSDVSNAPTVEIKSLSLGSPLMKLQRGAVRQLSPVFTPAVVTDNFVTWKSSRPKVVSVSADGTIRAVGAGTAVIRATAARGGAGAKITITVS